MLRLSLCVIVVCAPHFVVLLLGHDVDLHHSVVELAGLLVGRHHRAVEQNQLDEDDRQADEESLLKHELAHELAVAAVKEDHEVVVEAHQEHLRAEVRQVLGDPHDRIDYAHYHRLDHQQEQDVGQELGQERQESDQELF